MGTATRAIGFRTNNSREVIFGYYKGAKNWHNCEGFAGELALACPPTPALCRERPTPARWCVSKHQSYKIGNDRCCADYHDLCLWRNVVGRRFDPAWADDVKYLVKRGSLGWWKGGPGVQGDLRFEESQ